jgi:hypothetical protein
MIDILQIIIVIVIIIVFGVVITYINLKHKIKTPVKAEQNSWKNIEELNSRKKDLLKQKEELSFKYSAKSIDDDEYNKVLKYINLEISKIDENVNQEVSKLTNIQNKDDDTTDLRFKNIKLKGKLSESELEKNNLQIRVNELEEYIKNIQSNSDIKTTPVCEINRNKYYEIILNKYKEFINSKEQKTISEIKDMINSEDLTINSVATKFKPIGYEYSRDYLETIKKIYNFLKSEINVVKNDLKILFWLDFNEIIRYKIADEQDISIFLCSIMKSLDDNISEIYVVLLEDDKTHAFVKTKFKNTHYILDLTQKVPFDMFKDNDENKLFENYNFLNKKIIKKIYKYNENDYEEFNKDL